MIAFESAEEVGPLTQNNVMYSFNRCKIEPSAVLVDQNLRTVTVAAKEPLRMSVLDLLPFGREIEWRDPIWEATIRFIV